MSNPSGLPDDSTVEERLNAHEAEEAAAQERIDFIAPAFGKLIYDAGMDMEDAVRDALQGEGKIEFTIGELEQIAKRIAELNSMAMQGRLTSDDAERAMRAAEREATEHPQGAQTGRLSVAQPNLSNVKPYEAPDSPL